MAISEEGKQDILPCIGTEQATRKVFFVSQESCYCLEPGETRTLFIQLPDIALTLQTDVRNSLKADIEATRLIISSHKTRTVWS